jgi:hypothetical protein
MPMPNTNGKAYGLTTLCPLMHFAEYQRKHARTGTHDSPATLLKDLLNDLPTGEDSPMAKVPETYMCRFFVLDDVVYEGEPARKEHLKSKYLVFTSNFHGELEPYLAGMWEHAGDFVRGAFRYCVGFEHVHDARTFIDYIKRCQVETTFYFNGSTDEPLAEQLKSLYLKQEFSKFVIENQGKSAAELKRAFVAFTDRAKPVEDEGPTWRAGAESLDRSVVEKAGDA